MINFLALQRLIMEKKILELHFIIMMSSVTMEFNCRTSFPSANTDWIFNRMFMSKRWCYTARLFFLKVVLFNEMHKNLILFCQNRSNVLTVSCCDQPIW